MTAFSCYFALLAVTLPWLTAAYTVEGQFLLDAKDACNVKLDTSAAIPVLHLRHCGSHYALGYAIGQTFKDMIAERIAHSVSYANLKNFTSTATGAQVLKDFEVLHRQRYRSTMRELDGLAAGSGQSLETILIMNLRLELTLARETFPDTADGCSDVLVSHVDDVADPIVLVGHNEDMSGDVVKHNFFLHYKAQRTEWTAFVYAGELPTPAFGFNNGGLAFTMNALFPQEVAVPGIGRNFISRRLLQCSNLDCALDTIAVWDQTAGHSYNIIDTMDKIMLQIETGPYGSMDVRRVRNEWYFHANAYIRLNVSQTKDNSSVHREEVAAKYTGVNTIDEVLEVLGDTSDKEYPIYRNNDTGHSYTLCTVLYDVSGACEATVYQGNPLDKDAVLRFPLECGSRDEHDRRRVAAPRSRHRIAELFSF